MTTVFCIDATQSGLRILKVYEHFAEIKKSNLCICYLSVAQKNKQRFDEQTNKCASMIGADNVLLGTHSTLNC